MQKFKSFLEEQWSYSGTDRGHEYKHSTTVHGHKIDTYFTGGKHHGMKDGHYSVSFAVNGSLDQGASKVKPAHAIGIVKKVAHNVKNFARRNKHVKGVSIMGMDQKEKVADKKQRVYNSIIRGAFKPDRIGQSGDATTVKLREDYVEYIQENWIEDKD